MIFSWVIILLSVSFFAYVYRRDRKIGLLLASAFFIRIFAALVHHYVFILPAGCCDAVKFELWAWEWSQSSSTILAPEFFIPTSSYVISWMGAVLYNLIGREPFVLQLINLLIGTATVYVVYRMAVVFLMPKTALICAWIYAMHPSIIEHSVVFLREAFIIFFMSLALLQVLFWLRDKRVRNAVYAMIFFALSGLFHGAMYLGGALFFFILAIHTLMDSTNQLKDLKMSPRLLLLLTTLFLAVAILVQFSITYIPKIGSIATLADAEELADRISVASSNRSTGTTAYLTQWTINSPTDLVLQAPVRFVYFLYSPFPWDISAIRHLKGFLDSGFLFFITFLMIKYRKRLWSNLYLRYLLFFLIFYVMVFSMGTSNVGSAIRHKSKFLPIFVLFYGLKDYPIYYIRSIVSDDGSTKN